jgi:hypothetical protein
MYSVRNNMNYCACVPRFTFSFKNSKVEMLANREFLQFSQIWKELILYEFSLSYFGHSDFISYLNLPTTRTKSKPKHKLSLLFASQYLCVYNVC